MTMKIAPLLVFVSLLLAAGLVLVPNTVEATALPAIGVSGTHITVGGVNAASTFKGFDETTGLVFALDVYCNGHTQHYGKNQNFPAATTSTYQAQLNVATLGQFWYAYFWFCAHYGFQTVRIGAADIWGTTIMYQAWKDSQVKFFQVLDEMCAYADARGIYLDITLAGAQEWPSYAFGGSGNVYTHSHVAGTAYQNYYLYAKSVLNHFNSSAHNNAVFSIDVFNEPDHDIVNTNFWAGSDATFQAWAHNVALDLTPQSSHIVDMGIGGQGNLFSFNYANFLNATGLSGFDVVHRHYYASANDNYLFDSPNTWADLVGKPLIWGELAKNNVYPVVRWTFAEARISSNLDGAWYAMALGGTTGYPYVGNYPIAEAAPPAPDPDPDAPPYVPPVVPLPAPIVPTNDYVVANTNDTMDLSATMDVFASLLPICVVLCIMGLLVSMVRRN